jgi:hypothetical protein
MPLRPGPVAFGDAQKALCALALMLLIAGCDGHLVRLRIKEQPAVLHRRDIGVCAGQDVVGAVQAVARSFALDEKCGAGQVVPLHWCAPGFGLGLVHETSGSWTVDLADWPNSSRSALSVQAEAKIREALRGDCSR